ncbi:MAG TPA: CorA family divalent cation transporter, partial [Thermoanaerobaculia bacterium]|nr:CorA family divalent cation transporter [Thermoanaerobaculia bacterium]
RIMQTLTIVTVIFVPITFIAGVYGMNFEHMPELGHRSGYFAVLAIMLAVVAAILLIFRRWGWLGQRPRGRR